MIKYLLLKRLEVMWLIVHVILGILSTFTPYFLVFWVLGVMGTSFLQLLLTRNKDGIMTFTLSYLLGVEVFSRMARAPLTGLLPDEIGKYFPLFVLFATFLLEGKIRNRGIGWWIILLTIPSLFVIEGQYLRYGIVFNYLGIFNLALMILYFSEKVITFDQLKDMFRITLFPLISVLVFLFIKTPDYDEVEFTLGRGSIFETSGGYGPNQVSTALGIGIFILGYFLLIKQKMFSIKYLDQALLFFFLIRGLLTFSRGGVMVPILCLIVFYVVNNYVRGVRRTKIKLKKIKSTHIMIALGGLVAIFLYANIITNGALLLRYQGETAGTLAGTREKDLNHFTSHRLEIATMDIQLWLEHPLLGVGPGMSKFTEGGHYGFGSHVEYSRILAEHGILGGIALLIITIYPIMYYRKLRDPFQKGLFAAFILLAILTSFHAAMRTMVTPFFYGLAFAKFKFD